jgi:predicted RNA-binding Zn ribbon-like protein
LAFDGQGLTVRAVVEESVWRREQTAPQPGGRPPAPGQLALLQAFLNSHFDLVDHWGADLLASRGGLRSWLGDRGLVERRDRLHDSDVARALTVREALRQLIASGSGAAPPLSQDAQQRLNAAIAEASFGLRLTGAGPRLVPAGARPVDRALGVLLAIATSAILDRSWSRLKACPGHHCGWVFYDLSRNNSGRWCSMTVCGGREKSRAHYRRHRTRGD